MLLDTALCRSNLTRFLASMQWKQKWQTSLRSGWKEDLRFELVLRFEERMEQNFFFFLLLYLVIVIYLFDYYLTSFFAEIYFFFSSVSSWNEILRIHTYIVSFFNRCLEKKYICIINHTNDFRFQIRTDEGLKKAKSGPDGASRIS